MTLFSVLQLLLIQYKCVNKYLVYCARPGVCVLDTAGLTSHQEKKALQGLHTVSVWKLFIGHRRQPGAQVFQPLQDNKKKNFPFRMMVIESENNV